MSGLSKRGFVSSKVSDWPRPKPDANEIWQRPNDWPNITPPGPTEAKFVGLFAVFPEGPNDVAFTAAGNYTVDWGDGGSTQNFSTGAKAEKAFNYSTLTSSVTDRGYKTVIITITPQSGQNLTSINLMQRPTSSPSRAAVCPWLDIAVGGTSLTSLTLSNGTPTMTQGLLERVQIVSQSSSRTSMASQFYNCSALQSVSLPNTAAVTSVGYMFYNCFKLKSVPWFDTTNVTDMSYMFNNCYSLTSVPSFNTAAVTSMTFMFNGCYSLPTVPFFNTAAVTNMQQMFSSCYSLVSLPLFNTANVTNMISMFSGCFTLTSVPLFNTANVTSMNSMFRTCTSLISVPLFNTASVTAMASMFENCNSLTSVPLFNTAAVTDTSYMFSSCAALTSVPLFNTAAVVSMQNMFDQCSSLLTVPSFNTSAVANMGNMFYSCTNLLKVGEFDMRGLSVASASVQMFLTCRSLIASGVTGGLYSISYASSRLSATELNNVYTNLGTLRSVSITNATDPGTTIVYTANNHGFRVGQQVTITGVSPAEYNLSLQTITAVTTNTFTVSNSVVAGTYVSGGTATQKATITASGNYGYAASDKTIAESKGWTVN